MIDQILLSARLKECQSVLKRLFPDTYQQVTKELRRQLKELHQSTGESILVIAYKASNVMTKEGHEAQAMWVLAAAVEEIEASA